MANADKYSFKNLELWKAAQAFAVETARIVDTLPSRRSADVGGRQLIRSATSIAANIAEGHGRYSLGAYRNHLSIARGSAAESQGWLDFLAQLDFIEETKLAELEQRCIALIAALTRRMIALERQQRAEGKAPQVREDGPVWDTAEPKPAPDLWPPDDAPMLSCSKVPDLRSEEDSR